MSQSPPVSLLIPTFNSARTVTAAVQSCVDQTFKDIEILIYDEACRDKTREIINGFAARDPRIRVMTSDTNSGPLMAWRKLLHEARGRYCAFVFADDLLMPTYVEKMYGALQKHPSDLLATCNAWVDYLPEEKGNSDEPLPAYQPTPRRHAMHDFPDARVKGDEYALGIFAFVFPVSQMCSLFDTKVGREVFDHFIHIENPYGFDYSRMAYGNDVSFLSEFGLRSKELCLIGEPLTVLRSTPGSMTVTLRTKNKWQYWLQYIFAFRSAWMKCRHLSPRMDAVIQVADDRVHFCDTFYWLTQCRWPRECNPFKILRAIWFLVRHDHHFNKKASPATMRAWVESHDRRRAG